MSVEDLHMANAVVRVGQQRLKVERTVETQGDGLQTQI